MHAYIQGNLVTVRVSHASNIIKSSFYLVLTIFKGYLCLPKELKEVTRGN